jgi:hypothetical protein
MSDNDFKPVRDVSDYTDKTLGELIEADKIEKLPQEIKDMPMSEFERDFETARETITNILISSEDVIESMTTLAKESDSPRAYEVLAQIMKGVVDSSKDLVDLHQKKANIQKKNEELENGDAVKTVNNTQNNIVFQGTGSDLLKRIKNSEIE